MIRENTQKVVCLLFNLVARILESIMVQYFCGLVEIAMFYEMTGAISEGFFYVFVCRLKKECSAGS